MKKLLVAMLALATIAGTISITTNEAQAQRRGGAVAAGVIGGLAAGAIIGGAVANSRPAYAYPRQYYPAAGYEAYPAYSAGPGYGCPGGYWARRPIRDQWGQVVGYGRPRFFCPR